MGRFKKQPRGSTPPGLTTSGLISPLAFLRFRCFDFLIAAGGLRLLVSMWSRLHCQTASAQKLCQGSCRCVLVQPPVGCKWSLSSFVQEGLGASANLLWQRSGDAGNDCANATPEIVQLPATAQRMRSIGLTAYISACLQTGRQAACRHETDTYCPHAWSMYQFCGKLSTSPKTSSYT